MKKLILMLMLFAPIATFAQKFGHVNAQAVMESLPEFIRHVLRLRVRQRSMTTSSRRCRQKSRRRLRSVTRLRLL